MAVSSERSSHPLSIAVVGGGVAGITAAYLLARKHNVTLFEKNPSIGGHTRTVTHTDPSGKTLAIDMGFIVFNNRTYPCFHEFLRQLKVPVRNSEMSFSFTESDTGFTYAGTGINGLFARRRNLFSVRYWLFLAEILRFCREASKKIKEETVDASLTLGDYLRTIGYRNDLVNWFIKPMGAAIWSTPFQKLLEFPAQAFLHFYNNHGLLSLRDRPQWQTVAGGSHTYVQAFLKTYNGKIYLHSPVHHIERNSAGVELKSKDGSLGSFDRVILATHADEALGLLSEPTAEERRILGAFRYNHNQTVLHTDRGLLPALRRSWASWNVIQWQDMGPEHPVPVTYHMNRLQGFSSDCEFFVTLNQGNRVANDTIIDDVVFSHPLYTLDAIRAQKSLSSLQGVLHTHYCGSYHGYGFHEDAVRSSVRMVESFGISL